ncbi:MAG: M20/M25/M40 family metallo-hydrolase [Oscillospiraceae bacterium]|nr:M20/M25/M40 family metallo-hydrolase [Oscillospiraceae bacterium]
MPDIVYILAWGMLIVAAVAIPAAMLLRTRKLDKAPCAPPSLPPYDIGAAEHAAESLAQAVSYQTVSHTNQMEHGGYGEWIRLREFLKNRYPLVHSSMAWEVVGGFSLIYRWAAAPAAEKEPILICAHMDVVPAGEGWTHAPFSGDIAEGFVWGRGTLDCKNVLISVFEAAEALIEQGFSPSRDIFFAFGHDEEIGGLEGAGAIADLFATRNARFAMVLDEGGSLGRSAIPAGRPVAHVGVAEKGMANLRFTAKSGGGHAAAPPKQTEIGRLSEAVCRLEFRPVSPRLTPLVRDMLITLSPELPWRWKFYLSNLWLFKSRVLKIMASRPDSNALIRTTAAPTMARGSGAPNVLPDTAEITLNMRMLHDENDVALTQYLTDLTADLDVEVEVLTSREPSKVSRYSGRDFQSVAASVRRVFGPTPVVPNLMYGGTDARNYESFSDCVFRFMPFLLTPAEHDRMHGRDERVSVEALGRAVAFYTDLMKTF